MSKPDENASETLGLLLDIDARGEDLTDWEIDFISKLIDSSTETFTQNQAAKIREIHERRVK